MLKKKEYIQKIKCGNQPYLPTYIYFWIFKVYEIETASLCKIFGYKKSIFFFKHIKANKNAYYINIDMHLTFMDNKYNVGA